LSGNRAPFFLLRKKKGRRREKLFNRGEIGSCKEGLEEGKKTKGGPPFKEKGGRSLLKGIPLSEGGTFIQDLQ